MKELDRINQQFNNLKLKRVQPLAHADDKNLSTDNWQNEQDYSKGRSAVDLKTIFFQLVALKKTFFILQTDIRNLSLRRRGRFGGRK